MAKEKEDLEREVADLKKQNADLKNIIESSGNEIQEKYQKILSERN